jgi:hypothetical protein
MDVSFVHMTQNMLPEVQILPKNLRRTNNMKNLEKLWEMGLAALFIASTGFVICIFLFVASLLAVGIFSLLKFVVS